MSKNFRTSRSITQHPLMPINRSQSAWSAMCGDRPGAKTIRTFQKLAFIERLEHDLHRSLAAPCLLWSESRSLSTLRRRDRSRTAQDSLPAADLALPDGIGYPQGDHGRFPTNPSSSSPSPGLAWRDTTLDNIPEEDEDRRMDEWDRWIDRISRDNDPDEVVRMIEERQQRENR